jgi:hypothetical protein
MENNKTLLRNRLQRTLITILLRKRLHRTLITKIQNSIET